MTILIRRARPGEEYEVSGLLAAVWHDTHDLAIGAEAVDRITARWHAPAVLRAQIDDAAKCFLVAEAPDGALAGHAMAWLDAQNRINLLRLYVLPAWQGAGLGKQLLDEATVPFPAAALLRLEVQEANARAIRFYESQGLRIVGFTGERGGFTEIPALVMEKSLPGVAGTVA